MDYHITLAERDNPLASTAPEFGGEAAAPPDGDALALRARCAQQGEDAILVRIEEGPDAADSATYTAHIEVLPNGGYVVHSGQQLWEVPAVLDSNAQALTLQVDGRRFVGHLSHGQPRPTARRGASAAAGQDPDLRAPIAGRVVAVCAEVGQQVQQGEVLVVLEAMKMETSLKAPSAGLLAACHVTAGQTVNAGAKLCTLTPSPSSAQ